MEQFILQLGIMSLQASVVICVVLLVREIFAKVGIAKKYINILWMLPYVCMVCPWKLESAFGFWRQPRSTSLKSIQQVIAQVQGTADGLQDGVEGVTAAGNSNFAHTELGSTGIGNALEALVQSSGSTSAEYVTNADVMQFLLAMAGIIWLVGIIGLLIYSADAHLKLHRKLICCMHITENIYIADGISVPFVMGIFNPRIYLPSNMSEVNKNYVIAHEKTHIRHMDPLKKMLAFGITCLHWFNPLAWVAFHFYSKDMEMACDEETVQNLGMEHKQDYAETLLSLATGKKLFLGAPLAFDEGNVKSRIKNIVKYKKTLRIFSVIAVILIVVLAIGFMTKEAEYVPLEEVQDIVRPSEETTGERETASTEVPVTEEIEVIAPHELTMEELIELSQAGTETLAEVMQRIPLEEDGMVYTNLEKDENDYEGVLNQSYFCYLSYEGNDYRLQLSYSKKDNSLWGIYLYHPASDDMTLLYTNEPERYTANSDIEEFLAREYNIEDYFTCTLPEGTWLGAYKKNCIDTFSGCPILGDFEAPAHGDGAPESWYAPGGVAVRENDESDEIFKPMRFENGKAVSVHLWGNHVWIEDTKEYLEGCDMQAILCEVNFHLFVAAEIEEYMLEHNLSEGELQTTSKYWCVFMGEEDSEYVYIVYLNQDYFTKEDVIELARSVRITAE